MKPSLLKKFEQSSENWLLEMETTRDAGAKVAGIYCIFAPTELIWAAGAIPVGLCGKQEAPISAAEETLPASLCPLIKSSYGYAITDTCPFFDASDFIVGETTCDGKKKMFELMADLKPLHLMHLPYSRSDPAALTYWHAEILRLTRFLEQQTGHTVQAKELTRQVKLHNRMRLAFQRLMQLNLPGREPLSGMDLLPVMESKGFMADLEKYLDQLEQLVEALLSRPDQNGSLKKPRILLTGTPLGKGSEKVLRLIEKAGGVVVCMENCTGIKAIYNLVDESEPDPFLAIAKRYLETPCACMTPNTKRIESIGRLVQEYQIDGVVDLSWQCCLTYQIESNLLEKALRQQFNIPLIHISTDYSQSDTGQLGVRIEAFLELLTG